MVLFAILIITIWPWQNARQNVRVNVNQSVENQTQSLERTLNSRFETYIYTLQSGVGLLQANQMQTTRGQWQSFFNSTESTFGHYGIQEIGFSRVFTQSQYDALKSYMTSQGVSNFTLHPTSTEKDLYSAVLYLYPETNNKSSVIGFDMLSETARKVAMEQSRDSGKPMITKKVKLIQNKATNDSFGFILYVPYFNPQNPAATLEQRRSSLKGYAYGSFRSNIVFKEIVEQPSEKNHFSLKIYDQKVGQNNLLYQTKNYESIQKTNKPVRITKTILMNGAKWQFEFTFDSRQIVSGSEQNAPIYILLVGTITAFLVFLALLSIFKSRARELQMQKDKEVNLAKDELLSLASHQMRTPATGVKQYLGMVLQGFVGELDDAQKSLLEKAYTSNERQLHVINQILHLAKLESGRIVLAKHKTNLNELVSDIVDEQRDEITAHGHRLIVQVPKKPINREIDSHMMRMAIENILNNAIKYTIKKGTIRVKLAQAEGRVTITIKDSGIGIDSKQFPEIFKQFTRLYDEQTDRISGTGVGLYLADQLVKLHKGTLEVDSEVGKGSQFTISLPNTSNKKQ